MNKLFDKFQSELKDLEDCDLFNESLNSSKKKERERDKFKSNTNEIIKLPIKEDNAVIAKESVRPESPELSRPRFVKKKKKKILIGGFKIKPDLLLPSASIASHSDGINYVRINSEIKEKNDIDSNEGIACSIQSLIGEQNDLSWSSSLQSPFSSSPVNYSNFNSEEKLTLIPSGFDNTGTSDPSVCKENRKKDDYFNCMVPAFHDVSGAKSLRFHNKVTDRKNGSSSELPKNVSTEVEKTCCRRLCFNSPKQQTCNGKQKYLLRPVSCSSFENCHEIIVCDKKTLLDKSSDCNLENCFSPVLKQDFVGKENLSLSSCDVNNKELNDSDELFDDTLKHCSEVSSDIERSLVLERVSTIIPSESNSLFQERSQDISFGVLEEICQASEIFTSRCSLNTSITPASSKTFLSKLCTSTPINETVKQCIEDDKSETKLNITEVARSVPTLSVIKNESSKPKCFTSTGINDTDEKPSRSFSNSTQDNFSKMISEKNDFNIYSIISRKNLSNIQNKSLNDVLQSAKVLEDAEKNRKTLDSIKEKCPDIFKEQQHKTDGFLRFSNFVNDPTLCAREVKNNKSNKNSEEINHTNPAVHSAIKNEEKLLLNLEGDENNVLDHPSNVDLYSVSNTQMIRAGEEVDFLLNKKVRDSVSSKLLKTKRDKNDRQLREIKTNKKCILSKEVDLCGPDNDSLNYFEKRSDHVGRKTNELHCKVAPKINEIVKDSSFPVHSSVDESPDNNVNLHDDNTIKNNSGSTVSCKESGLEGFLQAEELQNFSLKTSCDSSNCVATKFICENIVQSPDRKSGNFSSGSSETVKPSDRDFSREMFTDFSSSGDELIKDEESFIKNHFIDNDFTQMKKFEISEDKKQMIGFSESLGINEKISNYNSHSADTVSAVKIDICPKRGEELFSQNHEGSNSSKNSTIDKSVHLLKDGFKRRQLVLDEATSSELGTQEVKGKKKSIGTKNVGHFAVDSDKKAVDSDKYLFSQHFSPSSGKRMSISGKEKLKTEHYTLSDDVNKTDSLKSEQLAADSKVKIKSRCLLSDLNHNENYSSYDLRSFKGFSTASGKSVVISKRSLLKAKQLFSDDVLADPCDFSFNAEDPSAFLGKGLSEQKESLLEDVSANGEAKSEFLTDQPCSSFGFSAVTEKTMNLSKDVSQTAKNSFVQDNLLDELSLSQSVNKTGINQENKFADTLKFPLFSSESGSTANDSKDVLLNAKKNCIKCNALDELHEHPSSAAITSISGAADKGKEDIFRNTFQFAGFSTASGKSVSVSHEALLKARQFFEENNPEGSCSNFSSNVLSSNREVLANEKSINYSIVGNTEAITTASGKSVSLSEDSISKAKRLFVDTDNSCTEFCNPVKISIPSSKDYNPCNTNASSDLLISENVSSVSCPKNNAFKFPFGGFSTASGKLVSVSDEALSKAKNLFKEDNEIDNTLNLASGDSGSINSNSFKLLTSDTKVPADEKTKNYFTSGNTKGFTTASGKSVLISEDSISKAKELFADVDKSFTEFSSVEIVGTSNPTKNNVQLNNSNADLDLPISENVSASSCSKNNTFKTSLSGFSTAGGKFISVSKEALSRAKSLFQEGNEMDNFNFVSGDSSSVKNNSANATFNSIPNTKGFTLASCKSESVFENSLSKAKPVFSNNDTIKSDSTVKISEVSNTSKTIRNVEHLDVGSGLPDVNDKDLSMLTCSKKNPVNTSFGGFSTASGKSVSVSNESLLRAKRLFDDENNELNVLPPVDTIVLPNKSTDIDATDYDVFEDEQLVPDVSFGKNSSDLLANVNNKNSDFKNLSRVVDGKILRRNVVFDDPPNLSISLDHEVSESAAALMFDEDTHETSVPSWVQTFVSSPSFLNDRKTDKLSPIICDDGNNEEEDDDDDNFKRKRILSPVLGSSDRFRKKRVKRSLKRLNFISDESPISSKHENIIESPIPIENTGLSFQTSTPINYDKISKRKFILNDKKLFPGAKKFKLNEDSMLSQDDEKLLQILDIAEGRKRAAELQNDHIKSKMTLKLRPCKGSLSLKKMDENRIPLCDYVAGMLPQKYTESELLALGIKKAVIDVTSKNAENFRFISLDNCDEFSEKNVEGISVGDGALVILDEVGTAGVHEISRAFLASPNVCPPLISYKWIENHYRWIVWKLASMERSFPTIFGNKSLTLDNLMLQLKYRYDKEIDACQRPAIRKILETDESSRRKIVVCITDVENAVKKNEIIVSDGWYSVTAVIDEEMVDLIHKRKVCVGTKLVIHGAELLNCEQGCDPLEVGPDVRLKFYSNSVRRARWSARLGFYRRSGPIGVRLNSILPKGGSIGKLDAVIARCYPLVYKIKTSDGKNAMLSEKAEERESAIYQQKLQQQMEKIYNEIQKEIDTERNCKKSMKKFQRVSCQEFQTILSPERLIEFTENCPDFQEILTEEQRTIIDRFHAEERERVHQLLQERLSEKVSETSQRISIPVFKLRLVDPRTPDCGRWKSAILTIWKPSEDMQTYLTEGALVSLYNISANGCRNGELQLTAGRQLKYHVKSHANVNQRSVTYLKQLNKKQVVPQFSELDVVGIVIEVSINATLQTAYIANESQDLLAILFWGSIKDYGWESVVSPGSFLVCYNLQWRSGTSAWRIPSSYVAETTHFTLNPKQNPHLHAMNCLKENMKSKDVKCFISQCREKLSSLLHQKESGGLASVTSNETNYQDSLKFSHVSKDISNPITDDKLMNKKILIQEKMKKLQGYGNPPAINELPIFSSPLIKKEFKAPFRKIIEVNDSPPMSSDSDS